MVDWRIAALTHALLDRQFLYLPSEYVLVCVNVQMWTRTCFSIVQAPHINGARPEYESSVAAIKLLSSSLGQSQLHHREYVRPALRRCD